MHKAPEVRQIVVGEHPRVEGHGQVGHVLLDVVSSEVLRLTQAQLNDTGEDDEYYDESGLGEDIS